LKELPVHREKMMSETCRHVRSLRNVSIGRAVRQKAAA
jgi:hypothetical protein